MPETIFTHLSTQGLLACSGKEAAKFLQGQLTCDVSKITAENTSLGAYCNQQGRVISAFRCYLYHDSFYLRMPENTISTCLEHLKKYAIFSKVTLHNASKDFAIIGLYGPDAPQYITSLQSVKIIQVPGKLPRFEIIVPSEKLQDVLTYLNSISISVDNHIWRLLDIEMGIPTIYPETQQQFLPHRINYHLIDGISFSKGCYIGQEIIARLQYRGTLKHHMYRVELACDITPKPGTVVFSHDETATIGHVVDSVNVSQGICQALLVLAEEYNKVKSVIINNEPVKMKQLDLPYHWEETNHDDKITR